VTLAEIVEQLEAMDPGATIYAARPWTADVRAIVIREPEDGSLPAEAANLDYFLEIDVALEAANVSDAGTRFERVLYYAENDDFLFAEEEAPVAAPSVPQPIPLSNDEIEVACDLLWFVKCEAELTGVAESLWERLQPIRHGDYGGNASTNLSVDEARVVIEAGEFTHPRVALDDDESALVSRLRSLLV
jgi:hypothetical protein